MQMLQQTCKLLPGRYCNVISKDRRCQFRGLICRSELVLNRDSEFTCVTGHEVRLYGSKFKDQKRRTSNEKEKEKRKE